MDAKELREALDELELSDGEAARLLYISPVILMKYVLGERKIPGPMVAAIEAWQRNGLPPGAKLVTEQARPGTLKLMRNLRDSLASPPQEARRQKRRWKPTKG